MNGSKRDIKDFEFQQLCKFRLFRPIADSHKQRNSLLTSSSKYGLCFAGFGNNLLGFKISDILRLDEENIEQRSQHVVENLPLLKNFSLNGKLLYVAISGDDLVLLVVVETAACHTFYFFETKAFLNPGEIGPFYVHNVGSGILVKDLAWNPKIPELLAVCFTNGNVCMFQIAADVKVIAEVVLGASCLCWSPKGKQLVVGTKSGELKQFQPQLTLAKNWTAPNNLGEGQHEVLDVVWVATYMFIAAYQVVGRQPSVQIVNVPKSGDPAFINFRDPCFGSGDRDNKYNLELLLGWDMVVLASSNSLEAAIIARNLDTEKSWDHWMLEDSARAEVPLTEDKCDSFPVGLSVDYSNQKRIIINEAETGPFPLMMMLSTDGVLVPFFMVYKNQKAVNLTSPSEMLNPTGLRPQKSGFTQAPSSVQVPAISSPAPPQPVMPTPTEATPATPASAVLSPQDQAQAAKPSIFGAPGTNLFGNMSRSPLLGQQSGASPTAAIAAAPSAGQPLNQPQFGQSKSNLFSFTANASPGTTALGQQQQSSQGILPTPDATVVTSAAEVKPLAGGAAPSSTFSFTPQPFMQSPGAAAQSAPASSIFNSAASNNSKPLFGSVGNSGVPEASKSSVFGLAPSTTASSQKQNVFSAAASPGQGFNLGTKNSPLGVSTANKPDANAMTMPAKETVKFDQSISAQPASAKPVVPQNSAIRPQSGAQKTVKRNESGGMVSNTEVDRKTQPVSSEALDSTFTKSIMEEINHFQQEMNELKARSKTCMLTVGTEEEKCLLNAKTERMTAFCKDIKNTTQSVHKEIDAEKLSVFEMFGILEECRIKKEYHQDVTYHKLLRSQPLDPASVDTLNMLRQQFMAVTNRLTDINTVLDEQWELYQKQRPSKNKKASLGGNKPLQEINTVSKFSPAGGNAIYQVIRKNHNIIQVQKKAIDNVQSSLKDLHLYDQKNTWSYKNVSPYKLGENKLSSLADTLLENKSQPEVEPPQATTISPLKQSQLREHLSKRVVPLVKSVSPDTSINLKNRLPHKPSSTTFVADQKQGFGMKVGTRSTTSAGHDEGSFLGHAQTQSIDTSTPLRADTKLVPKTGFFPSMQISNYASGLNLEDISSAESATADDWPGEEGEDYEDEGEEEYDEEEDDEEDDGEEVEEEEDYGEDGYSVDDLVEEKRAEATPTPAASTGPGLFSIPTTSIFKSFPTTGSASPGFGLSDKPAVVTSAAGAPAQAASATAATSNGGASPLFSGMNNNVPKFTSLNTQATTLTFSPPTKPSIFSTNLPATAAAPPLTAAASPPAASPLAAAGVVSASLTMTSPSTVSSATTAAASFSSLFAPKSQAGPTTTTITVATTTTDGKSSPATAAATVSMPTASPSTTAFKTSFPTFATTTQGAPGAAASTTTTSITNAATTFSMPTTTTPTTSATTTTSTPFSSLFGSASQAVPKATTTPTTTTTFSSLFAAAATTSPNVSTMGTTTTTTTTTTTFSSLFATTSKAFPTAAPTPATSMAPSSQAVPTAAATITPNNTIAAPTTANTTTTTIPPPTTTTTTTIPPPTTTTTTTFMFAPSSTSSSSTASSIFAAPTITSTATTTTGSVFNMGFNTPAPTTSSNTMSAPTTATSSNATASIFANAASSIFGQQTVSQASTTATPTSAPATNLFSFASSAATTASQTPATAFSASASTASPVSKGLFGHSPAGSGGGLFGQGTAAAATATTDASPNVEGSISSSGSSPAVSFGSAKSLFSQPKTGGSVFGQSAATSPTSAVTASATTTTKAAGLFGQASSPSMSAFSQPAFGQTTENAFKTNTFAQSAASTASVFGQAPSSSLVFGQAATSNASNAGTSSLFGTTNSQSSTQSSPAAGLFSSGGSTSFFSGLGGKPSEESANQNIFGNANQVYNTSASQNPNTANLFGSQSSSTGFKSVSLASPKLSFGASAGGGVGTTGFGVSQPAQQQQQQQQQASAFGAAPSFGSAASFGGAPTFGSKPSFGGSASFTGSAFGSGAGQLFSAPFSSGSATGSVFGQQSSNTSPGFANFAQSSSPTFGSLAQTSPVQGFSEGSTSNTGSFSGFGSGSSFGGGGGGGAAGTGGSGTGFGFTPAFGQSASFTDYRC